MAATILKQSEHDPTFMELVQEFPHFIWTGIKFFAFIGAVILVFIAIGGLNVLAVLGMRNGIWALIEYAQRRKTLRRAQRDVDEVALGLVADGSQVTGLLGEILQKAAIRWIMELVGGSKQRCEGGGIDGG